MLANENKSATNLSRFSWRPGADQLRSDVFSELPLIARGLRPCFFSSSKDCLYQLDEG